MIKHLHPCLALAIFLVARLVAGAAEIAGPDYEQPQPFTGTLYAGTGTNNILFTFRRTATRQGASVRVLREFFHPDGSVAARERVTFEGASLTSFQLEERQTGAQGGTTVAPDARNPAKQKLLFDWTTGPGAKKKTDDETLQKNTLVGDMIPYFIVAHWNALMRGEAVNFRFIVPSRLETVGFRLVKESEVTAQGRPAVRLRMEPSSLLIAQIVDPLFFMVEKDGAHRVLEYIGRTTPKKKEGAKWKDLDARTVYDWK